ncbi:MAG: hypothetical protein WBB34_06010 [Xanthobacteraceae bacterium]
MTKKFPGRMTFTQWKRTPWRQKHRLLGLTLNTRVFRYWRDCADARCRRARACQDHECYWRRLQKLPDDERSRVRTKAEPWTKLLWHGSPKGSEGRMRY